MRDGCGRTIDYLRISVTPNCNLRCYYCLPPTYKGLPTSPLTREEIRQFVEAAADLGVRRVRLTGGEPLLRPDLTDIIRDLKELPHINDISLTTNGQLLVGKAIDLREAGLTRVNVSLDTLQADRYRRFTQGGELAQVWAALQEAEAVGLRPVKINAVVVRGANDDEVCDLASLTLAHPWDVRFIELMPIGEGSRVGTGRLVTAKEIWQKLGQPQTCPQESKGPAVYYRLQGAKGRVGIISSVSDHFCHNCNRLRLTAQGSIRPCLLSDAEMDVRPLLKPGYEKQLREFILQAVGAKPAAQPASPEARRRMAEIGG